MAATPPPDVGNTDRTSKVSSKGKSPTSDSEFEAKTQLFKAGVPLLPAQDEEKKARAGFSSQLQYILAVIGMSVGLGNIWRFPAVAYENGGGFRINRYRNPPDSCAFLIPYLLMGVLFGLPMLYIDSSIGQLMQNSPSIVFKQFFPAAQGLGWAMAVTLISIGFIYIVPCCWSFMYIVHLTVGRMPTMSSCQNEWNTMHCDSTLFCKDKNNTVYFNGTCVSEEERRDYFIAKNETGFMQSAQEEFFYFSIANKHASFEYGQFNWMFALCLLVCWTLTAGGLLKGVQSMGKVALVTTFLPYFIITILFFRGVTLDGAGTGIQFFLTNPDWSKLKRYQTWLAALSQSTFSLSIGSGPMIMMSSYNKRTHPNYRDCIIILCADTFMSVMGGTAVFAILGSMAQRMNQSIEEVVKSPLTLTFIAYPEATSHMPVSTLWALLFFIMMFIIGISTMFALVESFATCIVDEHPSLAKKHWLVIIVICACCYALNILCFSFQARFHFNGYHIFNVLNSLVGTVSMSGTLLLEVLIIIFFYGSSRLFRDIQCMKGLPTNTAMRIFGNLGVYIKIGVSFTAPLFAVVMSVCIAVQLFDTRLQDTVNNEKFIYPGWTVVIGFMMAAFPLFLVPIGTLVNYRRFKKSGEPIEDLFRISDDHPSVRYNLPDPVSWRQYFFPALRSKVAPVPDSLHPTRKVESPVPNTPDQADSTRPATPPPDLPSAAQGPTGFEA